MAEWFEDDELWRTLMPALFGPEKLAKAAAEIDALLSLAPLAAGASVLDMPCGVGRHSVELAKRGHMVTGVDRTGVYLHEAQRAAAEGDVAVEWVQGDMRTFRRAGAFDAVLNLWTSFGYFADPADDARTMANFFANLKPGGTLVMEMFGKEGLAKKFTPRVWAELGDGTFFLQECSVEDHWSRVANRWILVGKETRREVRFDLRIYSASELVRLAREAGFVEIRCTSGLGGAAYDDKAERLAMVARRPL